jgi:hypothetical protein
MLTQSSAKGGATTCAGCQNAVYPLERINLGDAIFHRGCAKCAHCNATLTIATFASAGDGRLLCKPHFLELFKNSGGKYPTNVPAPSVAPSSSLPAAAPANASVAKSKPRLSEFLSGAGSASSDAPEAATAQQAAVAASKQDFVIKTSAPAPSLPTAWTHTKPFGQMTNAEKLAMFSNSSVAQVEKGVLPGVKSPARVESKPAQAAPAAAVPEPAKAVAAIPPQAIVAAKKEQVAATKEPPRLPTTLAPASIPTSGPAPAAVAIVAAAAGTTQPALHAQTSAALASVTFKEKVAQFKVAHAVEDVPKLHEELATMRARCRELESEVQTLRARLDLADAGKEALVMQIMALEGRKRENVSANAASPDRAVLAAKKLLDEGRITRAQFASASKAAAEARAMRG